MLNQNKADLQLSLYERTILRSSGSEEFRSILSGVCKISRLSKSYPDIHHQIIWNTSSDIIGPTFFFFMWWTLKQAQQQGIKRLYFLARDGQILIRIARKIIEKYGLNMECRYLYGSRQAWLVPSIQSINKTELSWIFSDWWYALCVGSVCKRLNFNPLDAKDVLNKYGFEEYSWNKPLTEKEKNRLKDCFSSDLFQHWFQERTKSDFENIQGYFKQEGLWDSCTYAFVDIGWRGHQQYTFNKILDKSRHMSHHGINGFYLGITEDVSQYPNDQLYGFLFDLSRSCKRIHLRNNHLYEAFAASTESRTINFVSMDGKYGPVFSGSHPQHVLDWGIKVQQEGILQFCLMLMANCPAELFKEADYYPALERILYQFIDRPASQDAQIYGKFPIDGEMTESNIGQIAPIVTRKQFWASCFNLKHFRLFWVQAVFVRSKLRFEYYLWKLILPLLTVGYYLLSRFINLFKKHEIRSRG